MPKTYTIVGVASHFVTPPALLPALTVLDGTPDVLAGDLSDPHGYTRYVAVIEAADEVDALDVARRSFDEQVSHHG